MRKKGFTLIELLVVIAIIAMLLAILMPALNKVKRLAQRLVCGTSVKGLGTAMMVYAQDFDDEYPMQGGGGEHSWSWQGATQGWWDPDMNFAETDGAITVSASLYLLVRNADVDPKSFVCRSGDEKAFPGVSGTANLDLVELYDFGGERINTTLPDGSGTVVYDADLPRKYVSYAFQLPYDADLDAEWIRAHPASATASASTAILADKNPWCDGKLTDAMLGSYSGNPAEKKKDYMVLIDQLNVNWEQVEPQDPLRDSTTAWQVQIANSQPHGREGQNVLFGDGHANFEKRPDISYQHDNIYTMFDGWAPYSERAKRTGTNMTNSNTGGFDPMPDPASYPKSDEDTLLVNDDSRVEKHFDWQ